MFPPVPMRGSFPVCVREEGKPAMAPSPSSPKQGSKWLRWILIECSHHFSKSSPRMAGHGGSCSIEWRQKQDLIII